MEAEGKVVVVDQGLEEVADKILEPEVANKIINMTEALDQPKAHEPTAPRWRGP